jgi:hypothetical protein
VRADREAGIEKQDSAIGPRCEETTFVWWCGEGGVVVLEGNVDVFETWGSGSWGPDGEGEAMGLIYVVIGILAEDYSFDCVEGCVAGPGCFN